MNVLDKISGPQDLRGLSAVELVALAAELRTCILSTVSRNGGHLAANLGVIELTLALLRAFNPPTDKILWDVGHQTYAWKLLTGRRAAFDSLRLSDGLSGFQKRSESPFDAFGAGHAGTALSAALGMAVARDYRGSGEYIVAVIGDASMGNGISLEALNNIDGTTGRLIVVLNDNEMSIGGAVGALSRHFGQLLASPKYNRWKAAAERFGQQLRMSPLRNAYHRTEKAVKSLFLANALFEEFGLRYMGPIDGHDRLALENALVIAKTYDRPILLHVATQKGRGYKAAEEAPERWHGVGPFDLATAQFVAAKPGYAQVFGACLTRLAEHDPRVIAVTAAMCTGTGLTEFKARYPQRFFDVGICEEHAVVFAAGLAAEGLRPVVAIYSTFIQRAVDCIMHDVCLQNLPVVFCLDRAGVVGSDGPTHHGVFDIAMLRTLPGLTIMQPCDEAELAHMLVTALGHAGPSVIRYPRDAGPGATVSEAPAPLVLGRAKVVEPATRSATGGVVWFWALGDMLPLACAAAQIVRQAGIAAGVVNARFVKPLDKQLLAEQAVAGVVFATLENGITTGGFGSALQEALAAQERTNAVMRFGWPDVFVEQGTTSGLLANHNLTAPQVAAQVQTRMQRDDAAGL